MTLEASCREGKTGFGRGESLRSKSSSACRSCGLETTSEAIAMDVPVLSGYHRCNDVTPPVDDNRPPEGRSVL
jgi:hypothetical protein